MGMVLHTVNIRLSAQDIAYIVNHAEDKVLIVDASLWPLLEPIRARAADASSTIVVMQDAPGAEIPPARWTTRRSLADADAGRPSGRALDENDAAGMCYTSGTTGHPKGVRLHAPRRSSCTRCASSTADVLGISRARRDPARRADVPRQRLVRAVRRRHDRRDPDLRRTATRSRATSSRSSSDERVTVVGAVPTVWIAIQELSWRRSRTGTSRRSAASRSAARRRPESLIEHFDKKLRRVHAARLGHDRDDAARHACRRPQLVHGRRGPRRSATPSGPSRGTPVAGVDMRIVDEAGACSRGTARAWARSRCAGRG